MFQTRLEAPPHPLQLARQRALDVLVGEEAADADAEVLEGHEHEDEGEEEVGDGEAEKADEGDDVVPHRVLPQRGVDAYGQREHPRRQDGHAGQGNCENQPVGDEVSHRQLQVEGIPEVARYQVAEPVPILEEYGLVQPIELPQRLRLLLGHELLVVFEDALDVHVDEVDLGHLDDEEADHGYGPHCECAQQDTSYQVVRQVSSSSTCIGTFQGSCVYRACYATVTQTGDE